MGVEPTSTGLQPVAVPSGSGVVKIARLFRTGDGLFVPKSSRRDWPHQKRPDFRQHRLNRLRLPQGQRSLRPSFSSSCLSPCTTRTPRLTCVSEGKPLRRLLIVSKKTPDLGSCVWPWYTSYRHSVRSATCRSECPCQESNLVYELRGLACDPAHSKDVLSSVPRQGVEPRLAGSKPAVLSITLARHLLISAARPGVEPGPTASEADMLSGTPTGHVVSTPAWTRTRTKTLGGSCAVRYTTGTQEPTTGFAPA